MHQTEIDLQNTLIRIIEKQSHLPASFKHIVEMVLMLDCVVVMVEKNSIANALIQAQAIEKIVDLGLASKDVS